MFALSAALAVAGEGEFLVDGEMHITDIQERAEMLLDAVPKIEHEKARQNLRFLARQHQDPDATFPSITEPAGTKFILERIKDPSMRA